jgi:hypothetical protein
VLEKQDQGKKRVGRSHLLAGKKFSGLPIESHSIGAPHSRYVQTHQHKIRPSSRFSCGSVVLQPARTSVSPSPPPVHGVRRLSLSDDKLTRPCLPPARHPSVVAARSSPVSPDKSISVVASPIPICRRRFSLLPCPSPLLPSSLPFLPCSASAQAVCHCLFTKIRSHTEQLVQ